jgi:hypothetical protein
VLRGGKRGAGSSFSPHAAATTTTLIDKKGLLENAQHHFQERLLSEMAKVKTKTAWSPFANDGRADDMVYNLQVSVQSFYDALDREVALHIKDTVRKLSTKIGENSDLSSIIDQSMQEHALAHGTLQIQDAVRKLNAVLIEQQQQQPAEQEESTTPNDGLVADKDMISSLIQGKNDMDALVAMMINDWQTSKDTFHDEFLNGHHQMDKATEEFGQLVLRFSTLLRNSNGYINQQQEEDPCAGNNDAIACKIPFIPIEVFVITLYVAALIITFPIWFPLLFIRTIIGIIQDALPLALEENDMDALVAMTINGWQSSKDTFHDEFLNGHQQMDKTSEEFGQRVLRLPTLFSNNADINQQGDDLCDKGDLACWVSLLPAFLIGVPLILIYYVLAVIACTVLPCEERNN